MRTFKMGKTIKWVVIIVFTLWTITPIIFLFSSAFKVTGDIFELPPAGEWIKIFKLLFFFKASLTQFRNMFVEGPFIKHTLNSFITTIGSVIIAVPIGVLAAYGLSRGRIPGKKHIYFWIISTRMAPPIAVMVPLYILWRKFGVLNTRIGLILAYTTFNLPFSIWILRGFMDIIPKELEEAAYLDGRSRLKAFIDIVLPLVAPGIGATVILCSLFAWNDYIFSLILGGGMVKNLPVGISELQSASFILWGQIMAGGTVLIIPMLILGLLIKKYLVTGLTMGAIKG